MPIKKVYHTTSGSLYTFDEFHLVDVSCAGSVPEAIIAFLESADFEHCIRLAISIGGDSDTIAAMAGSIAEAYYGEVPEYIMSKAQDFLTDDLNGLRKEFYKRLATRNH